MCGLSPLLYLIPYPAAPRYFARVFHRLSKRYGPLRLISRNALASGFLMT